MKTPAPVFAPLHKVATFAFGIAVAASVLLQSTLTFGHPSGYRELKGRADYLVATSADWLFWDYHPSIVIGIVAMTALYTLAMTRWRVKYKWAEEVPVGKARAFYGSMVLLWLLLDGPLHHLSDELLFSAHMFQHLGLQLVWAPLFLWSIPGWMLRPLVKNRHVRRVAYTITRPVPAFVVYNLTTVIWHVPALYNLALEDHPFHIFEHLLFMSTACVFWWPLIGSLPEVPRPAYGAQIFYVFANMFAMKVLGIGISLQDDVIYTYYLSVPRVWGLTPLADQQIGGLLMWLPGGLFLWGGLGYVFVSIALRGTPKRGSSGISAVDDALAKRRNKSALASKPAHAKKAAQAKKPALMTMLLCAALLVGCGKKSNDGAAGTDESAAAAKEGGAKTGDPGATGANAAKEGAVAAPIGATATAEAAKKGESGKPTIAGTGVHGKVKFELRFSPPKPRVGELFQVVTLARHATSSELIGGAVVKVDATMPHHGHGMMTDPHHRELGGGAYLTEGMKLHMHGKWVFEVELEGSGVKDRLRHVWEQPPEAE